MAKALHLTIFLFLISSSLFALINSARVLDEIQPQPQLVPAGQIPAVAPTEAVEDDGTDDNPPPVPTAVPAATVPAGPAVGGHEPVLDFFMHDVLGGSHPSARVVTGIIAQTEVNGIPFSKASNSLFPVDNGVPLVNANNINRVINPNTAPLLTGLRGAQTTNIIQNTNGNSNDILSNNALPFVTAGNLPPGAALQHLMFGTITVVDDQLTESHELGSAVIGKAQGFYLASSLDGTSQTLSLTVLLHGDHDHHDTLDDAISFFGVHRTASHASQIAVIGGTGKFEHAKGYAIVETHLSMSMTGTFAIDSFFARFSCLANTIQSSCFSPHVLRSVPSLLEMGFFHVGVAEKDSTISIRPEMILSNKILLSDLFQEVSV